MEQQQTKPTFSANLQGNAGKGRYNKPRPNCRGFVCVPDDADRRFDLNLWSNTYTDKMTGEELISFNGTAQNFSREDEAMEQIRGVANRQSFPSIMVNNIELQSGQVVMFQSKHEDGNIAMNGKRRADFYGYWNHNGKRIDIGCWAAKNEQGQVSLVGRTQYPMPGKNMENAFEPMSGDELERFGPEHQGFEQEMAGPDR